jgi:hypothetical protein
MHLGVWLNCSPAGAMVVIGGILFCVAWIFSPTHGLLSHWLRAKAPVIEPAHIEAEKA